MKFVAIIGVIATLFGIIEGIWKPFNIIYKRIAKNNQEKKNAPFKELKNYLDTKLDPVSELTKSNQLAVLRVELNQLMHDDPENVDTICKLFEEYKSVGGNKYMDLKFEKWKEERGF